jgi:hypothetical protein
MDWIPKLTDIKNLRDCSVILVLPMLVASFIAQTGLSIDFMGLGVDKADPAFTQVWNFLVVFVLKGAVVCVAALFVHWLLWVISPFTQMLIWDVLAVLFLAVSFLGFSAGKATEVVGQVDKMWFFTSFVVGFYCLAMKAHFDKWANAPLEDIADKNQEE